MNKDLSKVTQAINNILNVETQVKRKKKTQALKNKQLFVKIVQELEVVIARQNILNFDFGVDHTTYDEMFFSIIDKLISFKFGKEVSELVYFYLYERINSDGSINNLMDDKGNNIVLNNIGDLWGLILQSTPNIENLEK